MGDQSAEQQPTPEKISRRKFLKKGTAALAGSILAACGPSPEESRDPGRTIVSSGEIFNLPADKKSNRTAVHFQNGVRLIQEGGHLSHGLRLSVHKKDLAGCVAALDAHAPHKTTAFIVLGEWEPRYNRNQDQDAPYGIEMGLDYSSCRSNIHLTANALYRIALIDTLFTQKIATDSAHQKRAQIALIIASIIDVRYQAVNDGQDPEQANIMGRLRELQHLKPIKQFPPSILPHKRDQFKYGEPLDIEIPNTDFVMNLAEKLKGINRHPIERELPSYST